MNKTPKLTILIATVLLLASCTTELDSYQHQSPNLNLDEYFNGELTAWGMIQDYSDNVTRRFCVELTGKWQQNKGVLNEVFYFDDGEIQYRNWFLTKLADGSYQGSAEDVVGIATGKSVGFAFQWNYQLEVKFDESNYTFQMDDWLYQLDEYRLLNKTSMQKFGVEVAQITIFFDKQKPVKTCVK